MGIVLDGEDEQSIRDYLKKIQKQSVYQQKIYVANNGFKNRIKTIKTLQTISKYVRM